MADDAAISQFVAVTAADEPTAAFYLSAAAGNVDAAIGAFFESGGAPPPDPSEPTGSGGGGPSAAPVPAASAGSAPPARRAGPRRPTGGMATLASIGAGHDSDDDESGKNYYAGGEKSGQMIQDPRDRARRGGGPSGVPGGGGAAESGEGEGDGDGDLTEAIFERARARGPLTDAERDEFHGPQNFTGAGYRLGAEGEAGTGVGAGSEAAAGPDVVGRRNVTRTLTFYENGFTVDEGPLRAFDDPANAAFLGDIKRGFVPKEMEEPGVGNVSINLVDNKGTEYVAPKPSLVPFAGGGNRLGSSSSGAAASAAPPPAVNASAAEAAIVVDNSAPVASIQVRLSDGSRIVARLNETHTVANLRAFVAAARPGVAAFTLATTFPRMLLDNPAATIKDAGLNGAVVVQSLA